MRYARADELEFYRSSTTSPVKRRYQLILRFYSCSRIFGGGTQAQPGKNALLLSFYITSRTTDTAPMLSFACSRNSTALSSLHCSIRSRFEVYFGNVCGFDARRGSPELQQVRLPVRFSRRRLRFSLRTRPNILLYSDTVLCLGDNSIRLGRTDASR